MTENIETRVEERVSDKTLMKMNFLTGNLSLQEGRQYFFTLRGRRYSIHSDGECVFIEKYS